MNPDHDTPVDSDELIRVSDFESMKIRIEVKNTTTRTEVPKNAAVELLEIHDRGVVLALPAQSCAHGHNLMISFQATTPQKKEFSFVSTAKVELAEKLDDDDQLRITLSFLQYDEAGWRRFCDGFNSRQAEIEEFFKAARGF